MEKIAKYILIAIIGSSCFTVLLLYNFGVVPGFDQNLFNNSDNGESDGATGRSEALSEVHNITLTVKYVSEPTETWENFSLSSHKTSVLDALDAKCQVETKDYGNGKMVVGIDGVNGDWVYFVNGDYAGIGAAAYYLEDGDEIYWEHINS